MILRVALWGTAIVAGGYVLISALGAGARSLKEFGAALRDAAGNAVNAVNPANPDNVFSRGANAVVSTVTGDPASTVGNTAFDLLNPGRRAAERRALGLDPERPRPPVIDLSEREFAASDTLGLIAADLPARPVLDLSEREFAAADNFGFAEPYRYDVRLTRRYRGMQ